jgi:hypothetical protein
MSSGRRGAARLTGLGAAVLTAALLALGVAAPGVAAVTPDRSVDAPVRTTSSTMPVGLTVPWGPLDTTALAARTSAIGVTPAHLMWYTGFGEAPDVTKLRAVTATGATPMVTWEPWVWTGGVNQPTYSLSRFLAGDFDRYITQWADTLAAYGGPVDLRFAHEMNGTWYPWAAGVNGNTAAQYVAVWQRVHGIFQARGATNVRWVWSPNVTYPGSTPLAQVYPGHAYVDLIAVDGYNWGTSQSWSRWETPQQVFDTTFRELRVLAPGKPLLIGETASAEAGGSKATWIGDLFTYVATQPDVRGIIWFDENKETDWRIASSTASATAFRTAATTVRVASPVFTDVAASHPFHREITWLAGTGITTGFPDGTFRPGAAVTRDAMAAFLFRHRGATWAAPPTPAFTDVALSHPFHREIAWLSSSGISAGYADGAFRPALPVRRDAMAAFLFRYAGDAGHVPPATSPFRDVPVTSPFYREITWLAQAGISTGYRDGTFRPGNAVTRDAAAAFLHRLHHAGS